MVIGQVLGADQSQIFKVTLLQVIKRVIPPMGNEFINLVKDTWRVPSPVIRGCCGWAKVHQKSAGQPLAAVPHTAVFYLLFNGSILTPAVRLDQKENELLL